MEYLQKEAFLDSKELSFETGKINFITTTYLLLRKLKRNQSFLMASLRNNKGEITLQRKIMLMAKNTHKRHLLKDVKQKKTDYDNSDDLKTVFRNNFKKFYSKNTCEHSNSQEIWKQPHTHDTSIYQICSILPGDKNSLSELKHGSSLYFRYNYEKEFDSILKLSAIKESCYDFSTYMFGENKFSIFVTQFDEKNIALNEILAYEFDKVITRLAYFTLEDKIDFQEILETANESQLNAELFSLQKDIAFFNVNQNDKSIDPEFVQNWLVLIARLYHCIEMNNHFEYSPDFDWQKWTDVKFSMDYIKETLAEVYNNY